MSFIASFADIEINVKFKKNLKLYILHNRFLKKIKKVPEADKGNPFVAEHPDSPAAKAFKEVVKKIAMTLEDEK